MSSNDNSTANFSHADAFTEIIVWVADKPSWQQDALCRIVRDGALSDSDFDALELICLDSDAEFQTVTSADVSTSDSNNVTVSLTAVANPMGVNALASDQSLNFGPKGLSIVYGDNGSGKSGYVRVLKKACRSRDTKSEILPDINSSAPISASAQISYSSGTTPKVCEWSIEEDSAAELGAISIFDSRSANTHVQAENSVAYIPFPMEVIQKLADACDQLKLRLDTKVEAIEAQTPDFLINMVTSADSPAGGYLASLAHNSNVETLNILTEMSDDEKRRLTSLESDLAQDPKKAAAKLTALKIRLEEKCRELEGLTRFSSQAAMNKVAELRADLEAKSKLATTASESLFASSPLPEIGGDIWKSLWEAACKYSDEVAYTEKEFPMATPDDDLCVLCQQPLGDEAVKRRITFEEFVKGTTKSDEENAKNALTAAIGKLETAQKETTFAEEFKTLICDELDNEELAKQVNECAENAIARIGSMIEGVASSVDPLPHPKEALDGLVSGLSKRITELGADDASPERKKIIDECRNLKDRSRLADIKTDVLAEIARKSEIARLREALKTVSKRPITNKNKDLSEKLVTDALRGRFAREVEKLKIGSMPLELKKVRDSNARSIFRVEFVGLSGKPVGEVLSEGEHRCVALAAFLAELVTSQAYSAIVFDDPMSSLDHLYRKKVAKRLVEDAAHHQVIVFTHDLSILFQLKREAEALETDLHFQHVQKRSGTPGQISDELPMKAKAAAPLAHAIQKELKDAKGSFETMSDAKRTIFIKGVLEQLREGWDQAIADFIQPVLGRFDNQIKGGSIYKFLDLTEHDVKTITEARSRISEKMHTASESENAGDISHAMLCSETKSLLDWLEEFKKRPDKAAKPKISVL